jgi:hypothetical protein
MFDRMIWMNDRMLLNDLVFRLEYFRSDEWDGGDNYLSLYKTKELVEQYRLFSLTTQIFIRTRYSNWGFLTGGVPCFGMSFLNRINLSP